MHANDFHSDPGLNSSTKFLAGTAGQVVCRPAQWTDVVKFFLLNYGLHAITVITRPGDTTWPSMTATILTIFVPFSGIHRALTQIYKFPRSEGDALQTARKAGALCAVVAPYHGDPAGFGTTHHKEIYKSLTVSRQRANITHPRVNITSNNRSTWLIPKERPGANSTIRAGKSTRVVYRKTVDRAWLPVREAAETFL